MSKVIMKDGIYVKVDDDYTAEEELYVDDINNHNDLSIPRRQNQKNPLPEWLATPTSKSYLSSLSFDQIQNSPWLVRMKDTVKITFDRDRCEFLLNGQTFAEIDNDNMNIMQEHNVDDIDLNIMTYLYTLIGAQYADNFKNNYFNANALMNYEMPYYAVTLNIHDFLERVGMQQYQTKNRMDDFIKRIKKIENVLGIIPLAATDRRGNHHLDMSPALVWQGYRSDTGEISFYSPYLTRLIYNLMCDAQGINPSNRTHIVKTDEYKLLKPINHYLNKPTLISERNKRAVEIVKIVTMTIATAGANNTAHISADTIIQRFPDFLDDLNKAKSTSNKNTMLKRTFSKAWELLRTQTWLDEKFIDFKFPDINDTPSITEIKTKVWEFKHKGLRKKDDKIIADPNDE